MEFFFSDDVMVIFMLLSSLNSCTNPWIYMAFSNALAPMRTRCCHITRSAEHNHQSRHLGGDNTYTDCEDTHHLQYKMSQFTRHTKNSLDEGSQDAIDTRINGSRCRTVLGNTSAATCDGPCASGSNVKNGAMNR